MSEQITSEDQGNSSLEVDAGRRKFLLGSMSALGSFGLLCALKPFVSSWLPSAKAQAAAAPIKVDISALKPGEKLLVNWRGKPVWILRRTKAMLESLQTTRSRLRDPDSLVNQQPNYAQNSHRSINPEYAVLVGICTHLGCSPVFKPQPGDVNPEWQGGFLCPCHGSTFDLAGRVFKGVPAPINLEVPPYHFLDAKTLVIGEDA